MKLNIFKKIIYWSQSDRIGPDIPSNHWKLHFKGLMYKLCKKKFRYFTETSEFRPGAYAIFCSKISIGKRVIIRPLTMLFADYDGLILIKDDVMLGSGVQIYVNNHNYENSSLPIIDQGYGECRNVVLESGCWVGANAIILPGVTVGKNSVVAAGSVVQWSVPDYAVVAGNPAKEIRKIL